MATEEKTPIAVMAKSRNPEGNGTKKESDSSPRETTLFP
jgi:hypothetical protein